MVIAAVDDEAKPVLIRGSSGRLNSEYQRVNCSSGYFRPSLLAEEIGGGSRWNTHNYQKFDQLAYRLRHFWSWRVILAFFVITFTISALIILFLSNREDPKQVPTFGRFIPLNDLQKRTLAHFRLRRPLLSIDANNNLIILSSPENRTDELFVEQLALDNLQNGFSAGKVELDGGMRNCHQLSSAVHCCVVTEADETPVDKGTHCFRQTPKGLYDHSYVKDMQMTNMWQTLTSDETVVLLESTDGEYSILDTKYGSAMPILEDEGNSNLSPVAYFFAMDNAKELTELAQGQYKFHICEYLRDSEHRFLLQDCVETALLSLETLPYVKFCANPIYHAVIQFTNVYTNMRWQLQVAYTDTNNTRDDNIYTVDSVDYVPNGQIAMVCSPFKIDIYMVSSDVLVHYAIDLPKSDGETLIGNYF